MSTDQTFQDKPQIILDLCGGTGAWSQPYVDAGYDVRLITMPESDVRLYEPPAMVYGVLAAPPCTHLSGSGARWWRAKGEIALLEALSVVDACLRIIMAAKPQWWCLENPVGRLVHYIGKPAMYFNPCEYGDPYTKKTCLWGNFTFPIRNPVEPSEGSKIHLMEPRRNRPELRSITPPGFAQAFFEANSLKAGAE